MSRRRPLAPAPPAPSALPATSAASARAALARERARYELYQLCAQDPPREVRVLEAIHADLSLKGLSRVEGLLARAVLGEDFCAAAALARAWCQRSSKARAVGVDWDAQSLSHARKHPRLKLLRSDVRTVRDRVDVIAALNFSVCELTTRAALVDYLRNTRRRLRTPGTFICDLYAGASAWRKSKTHASFRHPTRGVVNYTWEQRGVDPLSGMVENAMHFRVGGRELLDAFVYHWRLWSPPELIDACRESGFARTAIYPRSPDAIDSRGGMYMKAFEEAGPTERDPRDASNVLIAASTRA